MNNVRYSANATRMINNGIALGSRPIGKGSRATSYNSLIRNNLADISDHVSNMRFKFKKSTHCHGSDLWTLEDNNPAHAHNLSHILYFYTLLHRKSGTPPALPTLVEFIIFLIKHPTQFHSVGSFVPQKIISTTTSHSLSSNEDSLWEDPTPPVFHDSQWGDSTPPDFADEIDEI